MSRTPTVGLIDYDGKIVNHALMKESTFYKMQGYDVALNRFDSDILILSTLFTKNRKKVEALLQQYPHMRIGGTGWDIKEENGKLVQVNNSQLSPEVKACKPDYSLYSINDILKRMQKGIKTEQKAISKATEIITSRIGKTSEGCVRECEFCFVPKCEGEFRQVATISELVDTYYKGRKMQRLILLDNNFTADPLMLDKCEELKQRRIMVDLTQGIDIRLMTDAKAKALSEISHMRSVHFAWDLMKYEKQVMEGIRVLSQYISPGKMKCFMLVGFDTTIDEDFYRIYKLISLGIDPYVMVYNEKPDVRLQKLQRWVNGYYFKKCNFNEFGPWVNAIKNGEWKGDQEEEGTEVQLQLDCVKTLAKAG